MSLLYRNQSIYLLDKSLNWFQYDRESVMNELTSCHVKSKAIDGFYSLHDPKLVKSVLQKNYWQRHLIHKSTWVVNHFQIGNNF